MSNNPLPTQDERAVKIAILKKAVLEERKKNQVIQEELKSLNDIISEKDDQISKLRSENVSLSEALSKNDPKSYYANMFKIQETSNTELTDLKTENTKLTEKIAILETDNAFLKENFDECLISYQNLQASSSEEIEKLKQQIQEHVEQTAEEQNKMKVLTAYFREFDVQKATLEEKEFKYKQTMDKLIQDNNMLSSQIKAFNNSIVHLKDEIEKLTIQNYQLKMELENNKDYPRNYIFKGLLVRQLRKIDTELSFTKYKNTIAINPKNEKEIIILINEINEVKKEKSNRLCIIYSDYQGKAEIRLDFEYNQIDYVMKYAEELQNQYNKTKEKMMFDSFDGSY